MFNLCDLMLNGTAIEEELSWFVFSASSTLGVEEEKTLLVCIFDTHHHHVPWK